MFINLKNGEITISSVQASSRVVDLEAMLIRIEAGLMREVSTPLEGVINALKGGEFLEAAGASQEAVELLHNAITAQAGVSLFESQINTLISTMSKVLEPESLYMKEWYDGDADNGCGFAACICGHQAVAEKSKFFNNVKSSVFNSQAIAISRDLRISCLYKTGDQFLACSIYEPTDWLRKGNARLAQAFTPEELNHPHLTKENPTPAEAISYMELVLTKLEQYK